jgi:hypothetical protein
LPPPETADFLVLGSDHQGEFLHGVQRLTSNPIQKSTHGNQKAGTPLMPALETDDLGLKPDRLKGCYVPLDLLTGIKGILIAAPKEHGRQDQGMDLGYVPGQITTQND